MTAEAQQPTPAPSGLQEQLSRIAILHRLDIPERNPSVRHIDLLGEEGLALGAYRMYRSTDTGVVGERSGVPPDDPEKQQALAAIRSTLVLGVSTHNGIESEHGQPQPDWLATANALYESAAEVVSEQRRDTLLVSAIIANQFAPEYQARVALLRRVYADGQEGRVAEACSRSDILLTPDLPNEEANADPGSAQVAYLLPIRRLGDVFKTLPNHMSKYLEAVEGERSADAPKTRKTHYEMVTAMQASIHDYTVDQSQAEQASLNDQKVGGIVVDRHKVERYALQELFLRAQKEILLGEGDVRDSPLARELSRRYKEGSTVTPVGRDRYTTGYMALRADIIEAVAGLSKPLIARYALEGVDTSLPAHLSKEQARNWRFRQITAETARDLEIARYIDLKTATQRVNETNLGFFYFDGGRDIWAVAEQASQLPDVVVGMIEKTIKAARLLEPPPQADEVFDLVQAQRRHLLAAASKNIETDNPQAVIRIIFNNIRLVRDEKTGKLAYDADTPLVPPGRDDNFDVLAAATLGCSALRVRHENTTSEKVNSKLAQGNGNYLDHLAAIIINEAYKRGMFDSRWNEAIYADPFL